MADAYGQDIKDAAKILHLEGLRSREIREKLASGNAGLPFEVDPSTRTIDGWRKKWKLDGIRAGLYVRPGEEEEQEDAGYRRLLGIHREALLRLDESVQRGKPNQAWVKAVSQLQATVDQARNRRRQQARRERGAKLSSEESAEMGGPSVDPGSILEALAAEQSEELGSES